MYERILVPVDGSDCAESALEHAIDVASRYDAEIHVLFVVDARVVGQETGGMNVDAVFDTVRERGESVVEAVAERVREAGVDVTTVIQSGIPDREIRDYAESEDCDLIVMGTHGRTGLDRYLIGSIAERTVRTSDVPVLTVRDSD